MEYSENSGKNENRDYNFVYFIHTYEKYRYLKIFLPEEYIGKDTLEEITYLKYEKEKDLNELITYEVYRFKIIPEALKKDEDQIYQLLIFAEDESGKNYQNIIKITEEKKDIFVYDFVYDFHMTELNIHFLSHEKQFEIYSETLKRRLLKKYNSKENESLILSTFKLLDEAEKKYNFSFYLLIFLECFKTKYIQQLLLKFKPENIRGLGTFSEYKIKLYKNILNLLMNNPSKAMNLQNLKTKQI